MSRFKKFIPASVALLPYMVLAQSTNPGQAGSVEGFITRIGRIINALIPIAVSLALLAFFWGLIKYIFAANDETKRKEGKHIMIWGILALFVMVSVWGLVGTVANLFDIRTGGSITPPTVNQTNY